jgi:hypothetical protein
MGGIRPVATWVTNARIGAAESVVYMSDGCTFPQPAIGLCYGEDVTDEKVGVGIDQFDGAVEPFALYGGVECFIGPDNDFADRARNILIQGEDRAIEERLWNWANTGAEDAGAATTLTEAIANVDKWADGNYLGRPIILMSRADAVKASAEGSIEAGLDGVATTVNGTPVVATGQGVDGNVQIVGAVTILRSEVSDIAAVDYRFNKDFAVAEAVYTFLVDCDFHAHSIVTAP